MQYDNMRNLYGIQNFLNVMNKNEFYKWLEHNHDIKNGVV